VDLAKIDPETGADIQHEEMNRKTMESIAGKTLGRYQLKTLLGEGGMGMVYLAYDPNLKRDVAIKVAHPHLMCMQGFKERFLQEAIIAARLQHPGIIQVYDSGEVGGVLYIVMTFIQGGNLNDLLGELRAKGEWFLLREAVEIVQQIADALDYAHHQGVLHRDIKPSNIMLKPEPSGGLPYRPVLTDLGLAKLLEGGVETQTGISMGTPAYMSPEQAQGRPVDVRSDVYSLGALLYHLCVGKPPFPAKTITEALHYHVQELPHPPRQVCPEVTRELELVILKTLEKDPAKRFPDAAQFAAALGKLLITLPVQKSDDNAVGSTFVEAGTAVSLITLLDQSIAKQRGASVLGEFPQANPQAIGDQLQLIEPGKTAQTLSLNSLVTTIGRAADNQIILDDPKVSHRHLRIEHISSGYQVTDIGSSNGSFLGGVKLLKGIAQNWDPGQPLKIGDTYLKLVLAGEVGGTQMESGALTPLLKSEGTKRDRFIVVLDKAQFTIDPGSTASLVVHVVNQGSWVDQYQLTVEGIPAGWVKNLPRQPLRCMPGQDQILTLLIQPPRTPKGRMGRYRIEIVATCLEDPAQVVRSSSTLTVAPFHQFAAQLQPERLQSGNPGRVLVTNRGNMPETYLVSWSDPANELGFEPSETKIKVEEGQIAEVKYRGRLNRGRWVGGDQLHQFNATVALYQSGTGSQPEVQPQALSGEMVSRGMIPAWLIPLLMTLCILLAASAGAYYGLVYEPQIHETATAQAFTAQETKAAAATAEWNSDQDNDGLTNAQEAENNTLPDNPDTDGDGLTDGQEVNFWHTFPNGRDTDGDTLTDGYEVNTLGTSPTSRDTDGDGLNDNVDPDPVKLPTALPTATQSPTSTLVATAVLLPSPTSPASPVPDKNVPRPVNPKRIAFNPGETKATEETTVTEDAPMGYILWVQKGQTMILTVTGRVSVGLLDPSGNEVKLAVEQPGVYRANVEKNGNYIIVIYGNGTATVTVEIPPL
jgi:eukaryotic-like serine/threonine-protein kinase